MAGEFLPVPATATTGSPVNIAHIKTPGVIDLPNQPAARQHSELGTADNNYIGGAIVTDAEAPVEYQIVFTMFEGPAQIWTFPTSAARNTAKTDDVDAILYAS
jgi:hypothetical protein